MNAKTESKGRKEAVGNQVKYRSGKVGGWEKQKTMQR